MRRESVASDRERIMRLAILILAAGCAMLAAAISRADDVTACAPIGAPLFSVDANSPVADPNTPIDPGDVLHPPGPMIVFDHLRLGLLSDADEVDGLSLVHIGFNPLATWSLLFSVDRETIGIVPPDPNLVALGLPFNVLDQAQKNQQAADVFMGLRSFNRFGPLPAPRPLRAPASNNTLLLNQGDASGIDVGVGPDVSPTVSVSPSARQSRLDAGTGSTPTAAGRRGVGEILAFSLAAGSPSLPSLPGTQSGADIYLAFIPSDPNDPNTVVQLYAAPIDLNLDPLDELDALIVFDDGDFVFDPFQDQVIFSLARGSPSLGGVASAADVFTTTPGGVNLFASANLLGLGFTPDPNDPNNLLDDNIDMLDFVDCPDAPACIRDRALGTLCLPCEGDVNGDDVVDLTDLAILLANFDIPFGATRNQGDLDGDGDIDLTDLAILLAFFDVPCP
ncbi:MAG: hypothetical protein D6744_12000 [Planctomycetota bacterium]|nr:MAG: hypothetical protein D6744_12000 [Planctomycetota bacterium]